MELRYCFDKPILTNKQAKGTILTYVGTARPSTTVRSLTYLHVVNARRNNTIKQHKPAVARKTNDDEQD